MITALPVLNEPVEAAKRRGVGCIEVMSEGKRIKLPLSAVQLRARVADRLAHVTVCETFQNPFSDHLEAVYIFPLPGGCAVSSFQMKVGERIIDGHVGERQAARQEYARAMEEGKRTALLEQDRDDVFTVQVGNLPAGEEITVILAYSEKLAYFDQGVTEIRLPLVVAPRYIPGIPLERFSVGDGVELDTDIVPDASRITPPRLASGVDAKIALDISVQLDGSETIEDLSCSQHATRMGTNKDGVTVSLARVDEILDRDFVLRWRVATDSVQSKFLIYRQDKNECFGMISLLPPIDSDIARPARDVIFVLDRSGSMQGLKMVSAARACSFLLATLGPSDRFAIQAFDDSTEWLTASDGGYFFDADEIGLDTGIKFLRTVDARGGTELHGALDNAIAVMDKRRSKTARMPVIVVLTDGEVGNEAPIFKYIQSKLGDNRVFTVGIDTAVNDGFLRRLASLGGGTATFVEPGAQLEAALSHVGREIGTPLIMDLSIEDINCGLDKSTIAPNNLSDLFEGRAVSAFFRMSAAKVKDLNTAKIRLKGKYADGKDFVTEISAQTTDVKALPQLWAKSFVVDLEDQYRVAGGKQQEALKKEIVDVAVAHSLLTKFTAFVVVDHSEVVNKDGTTRKLVQPVQMPAKWQDQVQMAAPLSYGAAPAAQSAPHMIGSIGSWGAAPSAACFSAQAEDMDSVAWGAPASAPSSGRLTRAASSGSVGALGANPFEDGAGKVEVPPPGQAGGWQPPKAPTPPPQSSSPPAGQPNQQKSRKGLFQQFGDDAMDALFSKSLGVGSKKSAPMSQPTSPSAPAGARQDDRGENCKEDLLQDYKNLQKCFNDFDQALRQVLQSIANGRWPDSDKLDLARGELLKALSLSPAASRLPQLQKYLRADLLHLLAALASATAVGQKLRELGLEHEQKIERIAEEVLEQMPEEGKPFWGATV
jgi:Ca-activated chloride channel family protein